MDEQSRAPASAPAPTAPERLPTTRPGTAAETLSRMDEAWRDFRAAMDALPGERLDDHLGEGGWTRKQMLAHISVWHDLTGRRLTQFMQTGEQVPLADHEDLINARAARAAEGRTAGEIMHNIHDSYRRLNRLIARLSDAQLAAHDGWAAAVIAGNTYDHYREHRADLEAAP